MTDLASDTSLYYRALFPSFSLVTRRTRLRIVIWMSVVIQGWMGGGTEGMDGGGK